MARLRHSKKSQAPKAWGRDSPNPITGRTNATSNGVQASSKTSSSPNLTPTPAKDSKLSESSHDLLLSVLGYCVGHHSTITLKNGEQFTGIFSAMSFESPEMKYVLKMVKKVSAHAQTNGVTDAIDEYLGHGPEHMMSFDKKDVVDLNPHSVRFDRGGSRAPNGVSSGFRTDTDISGNRAGHERELQKWEGSADTAVNLSLDEPGAGWDQFEANARLYGVQSDYDESFYTTTIDKTNPKYREIEANAERIAREIESSNAMNAHVAEERGLKPVDDSGIDEEMKYSGVSRNTDFPPLPTGQPNKYTPPARRPPTGQPGVPGVPVDPAIISSSLARPDAKKPSNSEEKSTDAANEQRGESSKPGPDRGAYESDCEHSLGSAYTDISNTNSDSTSNATSQHKQETTKQGTASAAQLVTEKLPALPNPGKGPAAAAGPSSEKPPSKEGSIAATVEKDVYNAFKQFNQGEKMRILDHQRKVARQDKAVKLNDLKKFAENFKLHTPVPQDLVPILAKEKSKQDEIVQKALQQVQELKTTPPKQPTSAGSADAKVAKPTAPRNETGVSSPLGPQERQGQQRSRPNQPNFSQSMRPDRPYQNQLPNIPPRQGHGQLSQRLSITQQQHRAGMPALPNLQHPMPIDPRMPPSGPSATSSGVQSPSSASRFNVRATEFRPNPAANTFQPSSNPSTGSSPVREPSTRPTEQRPPRKANFWEGRKPKISATERERVFNPDTAYNCIVRMKKEVQAQGRENDFKNNGGIPQAFRTGPTWDALGENQEKTYDMMFETPVGPSVSPQHPGIVQQPMPHQHQLPMHLQQGAQMPPAHTPQHTPRHPPVQPHGGPGGPHHMDDHRMQFTASTSSIQPSPRAMPPYIAYTGQGPPPVPVYQGAVPAYSVSPGGHPLAMRQVSGGPQAFMTPQGPAIGGHMMANQPSNGPYMNVQMAPQMQMYSPVPGQVYPQHGGPMPPQPGMNGYPSPRPPAPMMAHQGSQQGHPAQQMIYMQPGHGAAMLAQPPGQRRSSRRRNSRCSSQPANMNVNSHPAPRRSWVSQPGPVPEPASTLPPTPQPRHPQRILHPANDAGAGAPPAGHGAVCRSSPAGQ